jgi:FHA domain
MIKCANPAHPFCTQWVLPGATVCGAQHVQPGAGTKPLADNPRQTAIEQATQTLAKALPGNPKPDSGTGSRIETAMPYLHFSGFDPRAAGGRQTLKIELLGMAAELGTQLELSVHSELLPNGRAEHIFVRTTRGHWRPVLLEFSSRNREHGQYRMDIELKYLFGGKIHRQWVCTPVLLVPRKDASLDDIHRIFLGRHKNVKVMVDDASIAKISGYQTADQFDITTKNASIAQLDFSNPKGKIDVGFTSIAWDEDLLEIDIQQQTIFHPEPCTRATLSAPLGQPRLFHLYALDQIVIGRHDDQTPVANILLRQQKSTEVDSVTKSGYPSDAQSNRHSDNAQSTRPSDNIPGAPSDADSGTDLTRRISARHAVIRLIEQHFEIEDISRFGLLINGKWPGKGKSVILKSDMRLDFTASFKDIVNLQVVALSRHALVLQTRDLTECFYCLVPELGITATPPHWPSHLPLLYHQHGGFWHWDQDQQKAGALSNASNLSGLPGLVGACQFQHGDMPLA